jgi:hypothetical protein
MGKARKRGDEQNTRRLGPSLRYSFFLFFFAFLNTNQCFLTYLGSNEALKGRGGLGNGDEQNEPK